MEFEILNFPETKLVGKQVSMSFANNKTADLWRSFMPRRKEILNSFSSDLFSVQIFDTDFNFSNIDIDRPFTKWAAVPVTDFSKVPDDMETTTIQSGKYAVFEYKGLPADGAKAFEFIFNEWLPESDYQIDDRPHFEILGKKYKNDSVDSEEQIWIPIRLKD